jgi:hypothetical protein
MHLYNKKYHILYKSDKIYINSDETKQEVNIHGISGSRIERVILRHRCREQSDFVDCQKGCQDQIACSFRYGFVKKYNKTLSWSMTLIDFVLDGR